MDDPVSQFKQWYLKQPLVTRTYLTGAFITTILLSFKVVSPMELYYTFDQTFFGFDLWRPITSFLYQGKFGFSFLFAMFFCYFGLSRVEKQLFDRDTYADYLWLCISLYTTLLIIGSLLPIYWLGDPFIFAMIYIWCKRRPFETIRLFFGFEVKSGYFPWVFMGFQVLMGGNLIGYLSGLFCGHLYITIKDIYLQRYHKDYLPTPQFFKSFIYKRSRADNIRVENRANQPFMGRPVNIG